MKQAWRKAPRSVLRWRQLDGSVVIYDEASGDTHALDPLAAEVLLSLQDQPAVPADLTERVAEAFDVSVDDAFRDGIADALERLSSSRLIEREPGRAGPISS
jgi:PqqD family protein of HPr-rel-A system